MIKPSQQAIKSVGKPIHIPSNRDIRPAPRDADLTGEETIAIPDFRDAGHEYVSPVEAEKALRDLMGGAINEDADVDIDMEDAVVDGFREDIRLLPHQIIGRTWMKERENLEKKRTGGILADDMGYISQFCVYSRFF